MNDRTFALSDVADRSLPVQAGRRDKEGALYILAFDNGVTKVGRTSSPQQRVSQHVLQMNQAAGAALTRGWLSPVHDTAMKNETLLIGYGVEHATEVKGREYLVGASFDDLVAFARTLSYPALVEGPDLPLDRDPLVGLFKGLWSVSNPMNARSISTMKSPTEGFDETVVEQDAIRINTAEQAVIDALTNLSNLLFHVHEECGEDYARAVADRIAGGIVDGSPVMPRLRHAEDRILKDAADVRSQLNQLHTLALDVDDVFDEDDDDVEDLQKTD